MARKNTILVKIESTAGTGCFYVLRKNPKNQKAKFLLRKYDKVVRKHVLFKETKLKH